MWRREDAAPKHAPGVAQRQQLLNVQIVAELPLTSSQKGHELDGHHRSLTACTRGCTASAAECAQRRRTATPPPSEPTPLHKHKRATPPPSEPTPLHKHKLFDHTAVSHRKKNVAVSHGGRGVTNGRGVTLVAVSHFAKKKIGRGVTGVNFFFCKIEPHISPLPLPGAAGA